jgi:hypothetical protein
MLLLFMLSLTSGTAQASLKFDAPKEWVSRAPASPMRVAEFTLPRVSKDAEDAELVIFFFSGQGGGVQANIDRWISQMAQPDGRASREVATTTTLQTKSGMKVSLVDVTGTYVAEIKPGSSERFNKPGFRLRAAVVDTPRGPYFVKLTGPAATVARWDKTFVDFLSGLTMQGHP